MTEWSRSVAAHTPAAVNATSPAASPGRRSRANVAGAQAAAAASPTPHMRLSNRQTATLRTPASNAGSRATTRPHRATWATANPTPAAVSSPAFTRPGPPRRHATAAAAAGTVR